MTKHLGILASVLFMAACGRNEVLDKQENQRIDVAPALVGSWSTTCQGGKINRLVVQGDRAEFQETVYYTPECEEEVRTVAHGGTYRLANNFKEGINNSIIFIADGEVVVTLHTDPEVDQQNDALSKINNEKETEISTIAGQPQKKAATRENLKLRAVRSLEPWVRERAKKLNRLQLEKLSVNGLQASPVAEQGTRSSIRYELDNGFLQLGGRVYAK